MLATPAILAAKGPSLKIYRDEQPTDTVGRTGFSARAAYTPNVTT